MECIDELIKKMTAQCARVGAKLLFATREGKYVELPIPDLPSFWTNGFWPGTLWQMYQVTGDELFKTTAEEIEERLDEALHRFVGLYHDVGFMYSLSAVANYRITGNIESKRRGLHAASLLAGRFNLAGEFIRAWNDGTYGETDVRGYMIIDSLMNLPLLYWASEVTNDPRFKQVAMKHADTCIKHIVRPDGSCRHIVNFDSETGEFIEALAGQGYSCDSAWSRGMGWAVYGFALSYKYTGETRYLDVAKRCANFAIAQLAARNWVPVLDFFAPNEPARLDSSAGVLLACGIHEISQLVPELERFVYEESAKKLTESCVSHYANWDSNVDGALLMSGLQYHNDMLADTPVIYGDYFLTEAVLRLCGKDTFIW